MSCWRQHAQELLSRSASSREYRLKVQNETRCSVISLVTACNRVGYCFDLWQEDPILLVQLVENALPSQKTVRNPLAFLFSPSLDKITRDQSEDILDHPVDDTLGTMDRRKTDNTFQVGDVVKARLAKEFQEQDNCGEPDIDDTREWYHAHIISYDENRDTYEIEWDHGYAGDRTKKSDDMMHVFDNTYTDGVRYVLEDYKSREFGLKEIPIFLVLLVVLASIPQLVITSAIAKSNVCANGTLYYMDARGQPSKTKGRLGQLTTLCSFVDSLHLHGFLAEHAAGLLIGAGNIVLIFGTCFALLPLLHKMMCLCCPYRAKHARRQITLIVDGIRQACCPRIPGAFRVRFVIATSLVVCTTCVVISIVLSNPGILPLGMISTGKTLDVMNMILGDSVGKKNIQKSRIQTVLKKLARRAQIDISDEELRHQLDTFLSSPYDSGIVEVSLAFVTLIASLVEDENAESVRLDEFLIESSYAVFTHPPKALAKLKTRHDIITNVFKYECKVPGVTLEGERWFEKGQKLPWHLAIVRESVQHWEEQLGKLRKQLIVGDGCFTWRSPRNGLWRTRENVYISKRLATAKKLLKKQNELSSTLNDLLHDSSIRDEPLLTRALLGAGASVNFRMYADDVKSSTFVRACMAGKLDSVKILLSAGVDMSPESNIPAILQDSQTTHFAKIKAEVLRLISTLNDAAESGFGKSTFVTLGRLSTLLRPSTGAAQEKTKKGLPAKMHSEAKGEGDKQDHCEGDDLDVSFMPSKSVSIQQRQSDVDSFRTRRGSDCSSSDDSEKRIKVSYARERPAVQSHSADCLPGRATFFHDEALSPTDWLSASVAVGMHQPSVKSK